MKRFHPTRSAWIAASVLLSSLWMPQTVSAAETEYAGEASLYFLSEDYASYLSMPDTMPQSYQITLEGDYQNIRYSTSSSYIQVDASGVVTPKTMTTVVIGVGTRERYYPGDYTVNVNADGTLYQYLIHVQDYADFYAEQTADAYLDAHITAEMTDPEKLSCICDFICSYDYSPYHSDMVSMIVTGEGGDCWASTDTVNYMCRKLGFRSRTRNAANEPGAGSGHRNNVVQDSQGNYYIVDCGYSGKAPRGHSMTAYHFPFLYTKHTDTGTAELREYIGFETEVDVPAECDGLPVTALGESIFRTADSFLSTPITSVTIPDSVQTIGQSAFYGMDRLTDVYLPASVSEIGAIAFANCDVLDLHIDPANPYFAFQDGILYSKDMKTLISAVSINEKTSYTTSWYSNVPKAVRIPEGVETIADFAFYNCGSVSSAAFPESLLEIGKKAFLNCRFTSPVDLPASLQKIGYGAFADAGQSILIVRSNCEIEDVGEDDFGETLDGDLYAQLPVIVAALENSPVHAYVTAHQAATASDGTEYMRFAFRPLTDDPAILLAEGGDDTAAWKLMQTENGTTLYLSAAESGNIPALPSDFRYARATAVLAPDTNVTEISKSVINSLTNLKAVTGTPGSYAETLAGKYDLRFIPEGAVIGDCNADGTCSIADAVMLQKWLIGADTAMTNWQSADLNADGKLNVTDLSLLKQRLFAA